jgi:ribosomal protein L34
MRNTYRSNRGMLKPQLRVSLLRVGHDGRCTLRDGRIDIPIAIRRATAHGHECRAATHATRVVLDSRDFAGNASTLDRRNFA